MIDAAREFLASIGLPSGDLHGLPTSHKRFPDGAQYRVEIPSTEGPRALPPTGWPRPSLTFLKPSRPMVAIEKP